MTQEQNFALLCPVGNTGNVVPMTLNMLLAGWERQGQLVPDSDGMWQVSPYAQVAIIVPYTKIFLEEYDKDTNKYIKESLIEECFPVDSQRELATHIFYAQTYRWHPKLPSFEQFRRLGSALPSSLTPPARYITNVCLYMVPIHLPGEQELHAGGVVPDIDGFDANAQFQDLIFGLITILQDHKYDLHMSLAGGRKTMSAYQMLAATLFGASKKISHVLEPSQERTHSFFQALPDNIRHALNESSLLEYAQAAYQPLSDLYTQLDDVQFIDLSRIIPHVTREVMASKRAIIDQHVQTLHNMPLEAIVAEPAYRTLLYEIGRNFREGLRDINETVGQKLEQGILAGLWDSLIEHDFTGFSSNLPDTLEGVRRKLANVQNGLPQNLDELMETMTDTARILRDSDHFFRAIKIATHEAEALRRAINDRTSLYDEEVQDKNIGEILALIRRLYDVTKGYKGAFDDILQNRFISPNLQVSDSIKRVQCFPWVLALAFFNLINNVPKEQEITLTITAQDTPTGVKVTVEDNGPGFFKPPKGPENPNDLYELGRFVPSPGDPTPHHGLGLFVVKRIILAHKGEIVAWGKDPEPGAAHTITLPAS